ncbi:MAG: hypothetical protein MPJ50_02245 [Pirellulales bacterium]|nr:hypothetical protein [Pirellulales bacterium]
MSLPLPPHGELSEPINCFFSEEAGREFAASAKDLPKFAVSDADLSTVYRFADGALSPLDGPMDEATYNQVLDSACITSAGKDYAWTIPLAFPVDAQTAGALSPGSPAAVTDAAGNIVAKLDVTDVYEWNKTKYIQAVYGTDRTDHPGADMVLKNDGDKTHLVGGKIQVLPAVSSKSFAKHLLSPREVRSLLSNKGWERAVAFQTRNPLHRAHEYALLYGLETLLRAGHNAGACLNPLVGETKGDDVNAEVRMQTYEALIDSGSFGEGDCDTKLWAKTDGSIADRVVLLGLDIKMFYAGPKEAVMHGIYRQNYGFSDIVIGRKHADAPFHDGSAIWGDFDAQEIFSNLNGELQIQPVNVGFAAFYESLGRVDLMENHQDEKPVFISGKQVRAMLQAGEQVDPRIMRESTSQILVEAMATS